MTKLKELKQGEKKSFFPDFFSIAFFVLLLLLVVAAFFFGIFSFSKNISGRVDSGVLAGAAPVFGAKNAPVLIAEFSDFECGACRESYWRLKEILQDYNGKVNLVFRHFPATKSLNSFHAAVASECAKEKAFFWEYHDKLFEEQSELTGEKLADLAAGIGLNRQEFIECIYSGKYDSLVKEDIELALSLGCRGAPTFFVNGLKKEVSSWQEFRALIDAELLAKS